MLPCLPFHHFPLNRRSMACEDVGEAGVDRSRWNAEGLWRVCGVECRRVYQSAMQFVQRSRWRGWES